MPNNQITWDIDSHRKDFESEEHWQLRKNFMEAHKDRFDEEELVCLAQVFVNVEFLGCKYPKETMQLVAELSKDVAKDFRKLRSTRLQRTFVQASDAAEARAKGRSSQNQNQNRPIVDTVREAAAPPVKRFRNDLFSGLDYGKFVLYLNGNSECVRLSAQKCGLKFEEKGTTISPNCNKYEIFLEGKLISSGVGESIKVARASAIKAAVEHLQEKCYTIKPNPSTDVIKIKKINNKIVCDVSQLQTAENKQIDSSNIGYKMMKTMGWGGGGLGSKEQGLKDPVEYLLKNNRSGLSDTACKLDHAHCQQVLNNYINSNDIRDLHFEPTFTKDERALIHKVAGQILGLKSQSYCKDDLRFLIISKKNISYEQILTEVLLKKTSNYCNKYFVQVPEKKMKEFPEHSIKLDSDWSQNKM